MMMIVICHSACVIKHYRHVAIDWNFTRHIFFFSPIVPDTLYCIKIISVNVVMSNAVVTKQEKAVNVWANFLL